MTFRYLHAPGPLEFGFGFRVWAFEPGHAKLLLRGFPDPEAEDRRTVVDVVFQQVTHMRLDSGCPRLSVQPRTPGGERPERVHGPRVFDVNGAGAVIADRVDWAVLDLDGGEPSPLLRADTERLAAVVVGDVFWL